MTKPLLGDDVADLHLGVVLAMSDGALVLLLALELEDQDLLSAAARGDGAGDLVADGLGTGQHLAAIVKDSQHFRELNLSPDIARELGHTNYVPRSNPVLFPAGFNNGMHGKILDWRPNTWKMLGLAA